MISQELVELVQKEGKQYWLSELKKARIASIIYGIAILGCIPLIAFNYDDSSIRTLAWLVLAAMTIYAGASQVSLLPFMGSKPGSHWTVVIILAVLGFGGLLWLLIFMSYNSKADNALKVVLAYMEEQGLPTEAEKTTSPPPQAVVTKAAATVTESDIDYESQNSFADWVDSIDAHFAATSLPTRAVNFKPEALWAGYEAKMSPDDFVKNGYRLSSPFPEWAAKHLADRKSS